MGHRLRLLLRYQAKVRQHAFMAPLHVKKDKNQIDSLTTITILFFLLFIFSLHSGFNHGYRPSLFIQSTMLMEVMLK